jgi:acyl-CoA synthetase (AMP-forming)/AMP-acid ligase II
MDSIVAAVQAQARQQPGRVALLFADQAISYSRLWVDIERFARGMRMRGLRPDDRVVLSLGNRPEFVVAYFGTQLAGGVAVPIDPQYRHGDLAPIIDDVQARFCVAAGGPSMTELERLLPMPAPTVVLVDGADDPTAPDVAGRGNLHRVAYSEVLHQGGEVAGAPLTLPPVDAPALIAYTSGTTGRPKGAVHLHRNLSASAAAVARAWRWTSDDVLLLTLPLFHLHGLCVGLHGALSTGSAVILRTRFEAIDVLDTLRDDPTVTLFFGVPTMYARLLGEAVRHSVPRHLPRVFVSGSAPLAPELFREFERVFGCRILERYGMTETLVTLTNPYEGERRAGTVGMPFPGQLARVVDVGTRRVLPAD